MMNLTGFTNLSGLWKRGWEGVVELVFPRVCLVCGEGLVEGEKYLCTSCLADFPFVREGYDKSGELLTSFEVPLRPEKLHSLFYYDKYAAYKNLIYAVKYRSHRKLGVYLGHMLGEHIASVCQADCIVPVPLHPKRQRQRGFNQAHEIAVGVQEVLHLPILDGVVRRVKNNVSQTGKSAAERQKNVENVFALCEPGQITGQHVLLLDDVITTGATIGTCLRELARAENVKFSLGCLACTM